MLCCESLLFLYLDDFGFIFGGVNFRFYVIVMEINWIFKKIIHMEGIAYQFCSGAWPTRRALSRGKLTDLDIHKILDLLAYVIHFPRGYIVISFRLSKASAPLKNLIFQNL